MVYELRQLHPESSVTWVKSHQDRGTPVSQLPLESRMNVHADKLAGRFQRRSPNHKEKLPPMIEGTRCQFVLEGRAITSKLKKSARTVRAEKALLDFVAKKRQWRPGVRATIDWECYKQAIRSWTSAYKKDAITKASPSFLHKFLHGWLPVGRMVSRYNETHYPRECKSCEENVEEDTLHFLRCPGRADWRNRLRDAIRKQCDNTQTDPLLQEFMLEGIVRWLQQEPYRLPDREIPRAHRTLFRQQAAIGWDQLLYGRWSTQWISIQHQYLLDHKIEVTRFNDGSAWLTGIIKIIWNFLHSAWELRNKDRHGAELDIQLQIRMEKARRQIRVLYRLRRYCHLESQRDWFYANAQQHFQRETHLGQLEDWIVTYEPMIRGRARIQQQLERLGLQAIDEAFEQSFTQDS